MEKEFNTFDRILVKDNKIWRATYFSNYKVDCDCIVTTSGEKYRKNSVLPYEGNEELLGTDKIPKSKRWRAKIDEMYYFIEDSLTVSPCYEVYNFVNDGHYAIGNYFKSQEDAEAVAKEFQKILEHYEQGKIGLEQHDFETCPTKNDTKPSKEDILKVIRMLKDPCGAVMDLTYSEEETANIIDTNWEYF